MSRLMIHTAQLNIGKILLRRPDYWFLDATFKSGGNWVKAMIAPDWPMLDNWRKSNKTEDDWLEYTRAYLSKLDNRRDAIVDGLAQTFLRPDCSVEHFVLGCYCRAYGYCHRYLLKLWLLEHLAAVGVDCVAGRELTSNSWYTGSKPLALYISVSGTLEERIAVYENMRLDIDIGGVIPPPELKLSVDPLILPTISVVDCSGGVPSLPAIVMPPDPKLIRGRLWTESFELIDYADWPATDDGVCIVNLARPWIAHDAKFKEIMNAVRV